MSKRKSNLIKLAFALLFVWMAMILAKIFEERCLLCHEADLTRQQRLSRQGWTREVDKMVRWGAAVTDAEKEPLVDYLVRNFGPGK